MLGNWLVTTSKLPLCVDLFIPNMWFSSQYKLQNPFNLSYVQWREHQLNNSKCKAPHYVISSLIDSRVCLITLLSGILNGAVGDPVHTVTLQSFSFHHWTDYSGKGAENHCALNVNSDNIEVNVKKKDDVKVLFCPVLRDSRKYVTLFEFSQATQFILVERVG